MDDWDAKTMRKCIKATHVWEILMCDKNPMYGKDNSYTNFYVADSI